MSSNSNRVFAALLALLAAGGLAACGNPAGRTDLTAELNPAAATKAAAVAWQDCSGGYVAVTFDDGPHPVTTPKVLDALRREHIRATFFVIGNNVRKHPELVRREVAEGHSVQDHTVDHSDLRTLTVTDALGRLASGSKDITSAGAPEPKFYRPPYNHTSKELREAAAAAGLTEVGFTVDTNDWENPGVDVIVARAAGVKAAGIIQMHDWGHPQTVEAIARVAADLRARKMCPGQLAVTDDRHPDAPDYQSFHAQAVAW